jgi:hypothetical protein
MIKEMVKGEKEKMLERNLYIHNKEPPVPYNAALILVTSYVGKPSHMVICPCWLALIWLRTPY